MENIYKDIEIGDRKFRIRKFTAKVGSKVLKKIFKVLAPAFKNLDDKAKIEDLNYTDLLSNILDMDDDDFDYIQDSCLRVCFELLPAREAPFLNNLGECETSNSDYDIYDTPLTLNLTIQALIFNFQGFFEGSGLRSAIDKLNLQ